MVNRLYGHGYPKNSQFDEGEKYFPSIFFDATIDHQQMKVEVRPLRKDKGYYTINLNNVFLAHIHDVDGVWIDYMRNTSTIYQSVGELITMHKAANP